MGSLLHAGETVALIGSRLQRFIPHSACALYLRKGDFLEAPFVSGEFADGFTPAPMPLGAGISGWVAQSGRPIMNGNAAMEPGCPVTSGTSPLLKSALSIPLLDLQEKTFAVLTLFSVQNDSFTREHLRLLRAMETRLALTFSSALQLRQAAGDAEVDSLTGLPNAKNFLLQLEAALQNCRESNRELTVAVCDLNAFTEVNHLRGQITGNRLLCQLADAFRLNCAVNDTVARLGGDEFVFLLSGVDERGSGKRLEAIREATSLAARRAAPGLDVTASFGTAFFPGEGSTAEDLLALANRRMYLEKERHHSAKTSLSLEPRVAASA